ncbi:MAG TPA: type III pantothenate kinase, partial [bacterium]|nr:type III pantothenate kinase [bacterium]
THTHVGIAGKARLVGSYKIRTGRIILPSGAKRVVFCSVVPAVSLMWRKYFRRKRILFREFLPEDYSCGVDYPLEKVGADRLANLLGLPDGSFPAIFIDFGTAVTVDVADKEKKYLGGAILPGYKISVESLFRNTAKIRRCRTGRAVRFLGKDTGKAVGSGVFAGIIGGIDFLLEQYCMLFNRPPVIVITGGGYMPEFRRFKIRGFYDPLLTLRGLFNFSKQIRI